MSVTTGLKNLCLLLAVLPRDSFASPARTTSPVVDLGYAKYQGSYNTTYDLNVYKGIRYAAPPVGKLRWQAPQPPLVNRSSVLPATKQPPLCPQSGAAKVPAVYGFSSGLGNEDCLFLNVYAPPGAKGLPVLLWIHGGGYGIFGATDDPSEWIQATGNGFVAVMIQYRLGAFGFLSSEDVYKYGKTNAGLLDMRFALEWVQKHISKFGGDATRVTVGGESAGAGAVMLQAMAYGGREDSLFNNIIAASPYTPTQYRYNDRVPTSLYRAFAIQAGCYNESNIANSAVFECLVGADTVTLQNASANISTSGAWGTWAFLPVTDRDFVRELPSKQLLDKKISGKRILSGNNANDGIPLSTPYINTTQSFQQYLKTTFPRFTESDFARLSQVYQFQSSSPKSTGSLFDTIGTQAPTALNQSEFSTGLQQTVFNIFAETSFDCPSYWLADAFSGHGKESWKYQYSVTPALHGVDLTAYFSVGQDVPTRGFRQAFQKMLGNFIINDTPVISVQEAKDGMRNATVPEGVNGSISWPTWNDSSPLLMNLNTTGGTLVRSTVTDHLAYWIRTDPGVTNNFSLADAVGWENGRGKRCEFWRNVGPRVPQ